MGDRLVGGGSSDEESRAYQVIPFEELDGAHAEYFRRRRRRRLLLFVTLPGLILGSATVATAYGTGLLGQQTPAVCIPASVPAPARDAFTVQLLNSNDTVGLGAKVARTLTERGFSIGTVGNADDSIYIKGAATIYHGKDGLKNALLLQKQIPGSKLWNDARPGADVQLILGYEFHKLVSEPAPPPPAPSEITLNVYNTTAEPGLASAVGDELGERGFRVDAVGNDPQMAFLETEVAEIRFGPEGAGAAKRLAEQVEGAQLKKDDRAGKAVDLVLGNGWRDLRPAEQIPQATPYVRPADTIEEPCPAS